MTPILFYGPMARDEAIKRASKIGRPISEPFGDKGLKVDDSRKIVLLAGSSGVGDLPPSIVVGPLDNATPEAADALLKTLEDLAEGPLRIVLWADYLKGVIGTIRSRTLSKWCPPSKTYLDPLDWIQPAANDLCKAVVVGDEIKVLEILSEKENKKYFSELLEAFSKALSVEVVKGNIKVLNIWNELRTFLDGKGSYLLGIKIILGNM
jgi:DNA polymerase III delta prime subunit